tara:strand:- start:324 stop:530 length:207 start_codon:yes stop_codon:yes gene_type:complete
MLVRILKDDVETSGGCLGRRSVVELPILEAKRLIASGDAEVTIGLPKDKRTDWPKLDRHLRGGAILTR